MKIPSISAPYLFLLSLCFVFNSNAQQLLRGERPHQPTLLHDYQKHDGLDNSTLLLDLAHPARVNYWMYGGVDSFQQCKGDDVVRGLCASGKNRDCKRSGKKSYTSVGCGELPEASKKRFDTKGSLALFADDSDGDQDGDIATVTTTSTTANISSRQRPRTRLLGTSGSESDSDHRNGWMCAGYGNYKECPIGQIMVGACGSGKNKDCRRECRGSWHAAIKCKRLPLGLGIQEQRWAHPQKWGKYYHCGAHNEVACGACQSGKNADCDGKHFRVKCCKVKAFHVEGRWKWYTTLTGDERSIKITHGATKTKSETKTEEWSSSVTTTVETSLDAPLPFGATGGGKTSVSNTISRSMANTFSEEWSSSETKEDTITIKHDDKIGLELWQWVFDIEDPMRNKVSAGTIAYAYTKTRREPPRCFPGYSAGTTIEHQICEPGGCMPGYKDSECYA